MDFSYSALFFFCRRTSFTENGIGIDGCFPPTSCQASPDVDVALRLCVARRWLPGLAFGKTRKKSVCVSSCGTSTNPIGAAALTDCPGTNTRPLGVSGQMPWLALSWYSTKFLSFKTGSSDWEHQGWLFWRGRGQEVLSANCDVFCSVLYEFLKPSYNWVPSRHEHVRLKVTGSFPRLLSRHPNSLLDKRHLELILGWGQGQQQLNYVHSLQGFTKQPYPEWKVFWGHKISSVTVRGTKIITINRLLLSCVML